MLPKGTIVEIFEDPRTKQRKEGNASIVSCLAEHDGDGLSIYAVHFIGDDPALSVPRLIDEKEIYSEVRHV